MIEHLKRATTHEVWAVIRIAHPDLVVFSSFSDPSGTFAGGAGTTGRMDTEYGFPGAPCPLIGASTTWEIDGDRPHERRDEKHRFWLCDPLEEVEP